MTQRFRLIVPVLVAGVIFAASSVEAKPKKVTVTVAEFSFTPQYIQVSVGDTVEWKNAGASTHTATNGYGSNDPTAGTVFDSGALLPGGTYRKVFTGTGKYPYFCQPHEFLNMKGAVSIVSPAHKRIDVQANDNLITQSFFFSPSSITAAPGDTVRWTNVGHTTHTATSGTAGGSDEGVVFNSGALNVGQVFTWVVSDTSGVLAYHCIPHADLGMVGSITIQATSIAQVGAPVALATRAYPSPSRGGVVLNFELPRSGALVVELLDVQSRVVAELYHGAASAGAQRFAWSGMRADGHRVAAGEYFYRVVSDGHVSSGRMVMLP